VPTKAISISQGFTANDKDLSVGMIAALSSDSTPDNQIVERGSTTNQSKIVGIVTTINSNLLTLTNTSAQVHVTTSGEATVYASDLNGTIKKGDFVTASPLRGVGMRVGDESTTIVGVALQDFPSDKAKTQKVLTSDSSDKTVLVAQMKIDVQPRNISAQQAAAKKGGFLLLFGQSITGKSVGSVQVVVALVIFFLLLVVEGSIIYGAIHSTIGALGRNPLAKSAVYRQLLQVSWLALAVLAFGLGAIYIILWI
jgi:hypothetical protein